MFFAVALTLGCAGLTDSASAQMLVNEFGRVYVGTDPRLGDDTAHVLAMSIQGTNGEYRSGAKLAFGDFGLQERNGWNVFIGEWGTYDSDKLWLHGKKGFALTAYTGNYTVAKWSTDMNHKSFFNIYDGVRMDRLSVSSDDCHKSDIQPIPCALPRLVNMGGIVYHYQPLNNHQPVGETGEIVNLGELTPKEMTDMEEYCLAMSARENGNLRYGLMANEVMNMFPELVDIDDEGNTYINYLELIPIMISAIRELYQTLEQNGLQFGLRESYENYMRAVHSDSLTDSNSASKRHNNSIGNTIDSAVLYQNSPNPFSSATSVEYYIPSSATSAALYVFNLIGELQRTYPINNTGRNAVRIDCVGLNAGMYIYSLVVDGQVVDTKRMILTR